MLQVSEGRYVIDFIEAFCRPSKGGGLLQLRPWQRDLINDLFVLDEDGRRRYRTALIGMPRKNGKALALDTPIPTPTGWSTMGDLQVGKEVFDERGRSCRVVAATEVLLGRSCYRVDFSDGSSIVADADHQWYVEPRWCNRPYVLTTEEMVGRVKMRPRASGRYDEHRYRIPVAGPLDTDGTELPVAPYTFGAWLGDGHSAGARLTSADDEVFEQINRDGYAVGAKVERTGAAETRSIGVTGRGQPGSLQATLRRIDVLHQKHIPTTYLRASVCQRLALLQGLMDTDGYISKAGQCVFTTTKHALATGVLELVRSLGIKPTLQEKRAILDGRDCGPKWHVQFWPPVDMPVFRLARKATRQRSSAAGWRRASGRYIAAITPVPSVPVRCIEVDSPSHLYLAGDAMVPTHNSTLGAALALYGLLMDDQQGAEVYSVAGDRMQAGIVFREAKAMIEADAELVERCRVYRHHVEVPDTGAVYRVLSADAPRAQGLNPSFVIFDEVHVQPNEDLWHAMTLGMGARQQPMVVGITTAGFDRASLAGRLYDHGKRVQSGEVDDPTFFFRWWEPADPGADWHDPKVWQASNPAFGDFLQPESFEADARNTPENQFRRFRLNQWTTTRDAWLPHGVWEEAKDKNRKVAPDEPIVLGGDAAWTGDSTALVGCTVNNPHLFVVASWEPDDGPIDADEVDQAVREAYANYKVVRFGFDPFLWRQELNRWKKDGIPVEEWPTNALARMVPACGEFYRAVLEQRVTHDGNPALARHMANAVVKDDRWGRRIVKDSSTRKIDLAVAAIVAFDLSRKPLPRTRRLVSY